jgi:hypothetical protein
MRLFLTLLLLSTSVMPPADEPQSQTGLRVTTWMNDNAHTGQNLKETTLTPANVNVNSFSKLGAYPVDGQVFAQPLYWQALAISGQGTFNVLFVVTENDSVYTFDADNPGSAALWHVNFTSPPNITSVPCADIEKSCHIYPVVGITGTPVIDPGTQTIYLVARTKETSNGVTTYVQRLHALDITTGGEKFGGPVVITATGGSTSLDPQRSSQRPALLLVPGVGGAHSTVYIAFAGYTHTGSLVLPGWLLAYDSQTLQQLAVFNTTPTGRNGGVWGAGGGMSADLGGNIYIATADGTFDVNTGGADYGDSVVKLKLSGNTFTVFDYFTPKDQSCRTQNDYDLGSGSPLLLPHDSTARVPDEFIMAGKGGSPCDPFPSSYAAPIYLLNQKKLGHFSSNKDNVVQTVPGAPSGYWSAPSYWQGTNSQGITSKYIYFGGVTGDASLGPGDYLKMWTLSGGLLSTSPVAQSPAIFEVGTTPSISANGTANGILWAIERQDRLGLEPGAKPAVLHAYDATNLATELYNSAQAGTRDQAGPGAKYVVPVVANGRVYVGTQTEVDVYGLTK